MKLMNKDEFIAYELKFYFMKNKLKEGEKLPSERDLAEQFGPFLLLSQYSFCLTGQKIPLSHIHIPYTVLIFP